MNDWSSPRSEAKASGWLQNIVAKTDVLFLIIECNGRHRRVWYRALSRRYACIRSLDIILIP